MCVTIINGVVIKGMVVRAVEGSMYQAEGVKPRASRQAGGYDYVELTD